MASDWIETTIGEQMLLQRGLDITKAEQRTGQIPVISSGGVSSYHDTSAAKGPGVILGRKGVVGSVYYSAEDYWPHDTTLWVKEFRGNDPRFVYYFFKSNAQRLADLDVGSANPTLNRNHVHPMPVRWPREKEQVAIAAVLAAMDDKIDANRRLNRTLEGIARAVFRSWFVDFDPVRAKADGRTPAGLDAATAALFPDRFEDSPLGPIPAGWTVEPLDEAADFLNGLALQKYPPLAGEPVLPVIKIAQLRAGHTTGADLANDKVPMAYVVEDGDLLFSWSGSLLVDIWSGGRGALNQHLFKVTSARFPRWLVHRWILEHLPSFQATAAAKATTMGHIQRRHLTEALVVVPPTKMVEAADNLMGDLLQQQLQNSLQSRTLATLRDTLLPKLISGEVRVPG